MADEVIMPKAGMAMESGIILKWLKAEGDEVRTGEPLLEIETDKVSMEVEAETSGVLLRILRREGEEVPVTEVIGYIGKAGEDVPAIDQSHGHSVSGASPTSPVGADLKAPTRIAATPLARTLATERGIELTAAVPSGPDGEVKARDVLSVESGARVNASPLARRIAELQGVDLNLLSGTGPSGKILKQDVITGGQRPGSPTQIPEAPISPARKRIAQRMVESHASIPPVTLNSEADVTELLALMEQIGLHGENHYSFNDFILAATTASLKIHPNLMQQLDGDRLIFPSVVNLGVAVSVRDLLFVPVIHDATSLSFADLAMRAHTLVEKARSNKLLPDDVSGATFTVSNLGMFQISDFTPIINPPESAILGIGSIRDCLQLAEEKVVGRKKITLSLTIDHRILDGVAGARFLSSLREMLEYPLRLLV